MTFCQQYDIMKIAYLINGYLSHQYYYTVMNDKTTFLISDSCIQIVVVNSVHGASEFI